MIKLTLALHGQRWRSVYTIPKGEILSKGRHGLYHEIVKAAGSVSQKFGCYSWGNHQSIYYCGSFAKDYARGNFLSNLHGRVHNYLQNHRVKDTGHKNTNLIVFERINEALVQSDVVLQLLVFDSLQFGDSSVDFATYSNDPSLVHAVEELLICSYRRIGQCVLICTEI